MATIIPGHLATYIFNTEDEYREDYQKSVFGKTCKKGGWDCVRHYEILANGCIPHFDNLENMPKNTMTHFPRELVLEAMKSQTPEIYIPALLEHTRKHLTTRAMAQYVFDTIGNPSPKRVLFLSCDPYPDYLRCLMLSGMKELLGSNCCETIVVPHIYDDYGDASKLYGKGFSYTKTIPASSRCPPVTYEEIVNHAFDVVVFGSIHRGMPYWNEVSAVYSQKEIAILCGEDLDLEGPHHTCSGVELANNGYNVFVREL